MNNYNELADHAGATLPELEKAWEPIKRDILTFVDQQRKPFFFTEVGWHNLDNTVKEPWNYVAEGAIDPKEQLHAYQSFVATWANVPHNKFMGAFVWEWRPGSKPEDHGTYSLQGEPAARSRQEMDDHPLTQTAAKYSVCVCLCLSVANFIPPHPAL